MAWVYRYTDLNDGIIKYIGIVWSGNRTLKERIKEHKLNDSWCKNGKWKIEYLDEEINTRNEAEALESHLIALYNTWQYFNKSKKTHGINKYIPEMDYKWKIFDFEDKDILPKEKTITASIRITRERKQKIKEYAVINNTTISDLISNYIDQL